MAGRRGGLAFVGLGLHDENGVTVQGLEEIAAAEVVFVEAYTSFLSEGAFNRLAARTGKNIETIDRATLEDGRRVLEACRQSKVALLVPGDPMTATTHVELRLRAIAQGTETRVIHGVSALIAVPGLLGLQHYKFGRTVTLPLPQEGYSPTSPYELIGENLARGLHTLVLLDINAENSRFMTADQGMHLLLDMERRTQLHALSEDSLVCVVARAGSPDCMVRAGAMKDLIRMDFGAPLHTIAVPGKLHFMERDALRVLGGMKEFA